MDDQDFGHMRLGAVEVGIAVRQVANDEKGAISDVVSDAIQSPAG